MGKRKSVPPIEYGEVVEVPMAHDMDDETFLLHLEKRHRAECQIETVLRRDALHAWVPTYRAFHERLHKLEVPGQHDHSHEEDW